MQINPNHAANLLGGKARGNRVSCPGPGHGKLDRSLVVTFNADGSFHAKSFADDDFKECRDYVKARLGLSDDMPSARRIYQYTPSSGTSQARIAMLGRLWDSCVPIAGTLGERYLKSRGVTYEGDAWRFRPSSRCLIALITDALTGERCGYHETILDAEGRKLTRLMHGRAAGGVVRLYDHEAPFGLAIAEGIETALSTDFRPVWAALSAGGVSSFPVLPGIDTLTVFADHDRAGIQAANAVGKRWHEAGREVTLIAPKIHGKDFADREAA